MGARSCGVECESKARMMTTEVASKSSKDNFLSMARPALIQLKDEPASGEFLSSWSDNLNSDSPLRGSGMASLEYGVWYEPPMVVYWKIFFCKSSNPTGPSPCG